MAVDLGHLEWLGNKDSANGIMVIKLTPGDCRISLDSIEYFYCIQRQLEDAYEQGKKDAQERFRHCIIEAMTIATRSL